MSAPERIAVEPSVMGWARTSAGLDVAEAARRLSVSEDTVRGWESGDRQPTVRQLRNAGLRG
jgi:DNA-binding transcriptional regulator YiaG